MKTRPSAPTLALLAGAAFWGVVWYPYRILAAAGLDGLWSTIATFGGALVAGCLIFPRAAVSLFPLSFSAIVMGLAIGWSNLAYVLAVLQADVMRVLLLFYLAPLWTVPLARFILGERLDRFGFAVMALALAGAVTMLWRPELGAPWPSSRGEWLAVLAGFLFALGNVLVRKIRHLGDAAKSIMIWAGVTIAALVHLPTSASSPADAWRAMAATAPIVGAIAFALLGMSLSLQYGLARLPANRAIVILLFELVVAAIAAYFLAGEVLRPQDWLGGALVIAASIAAGWGGAARRGPASDSRELRQ